MGTIGLALTVEPIHLQPTNDFQEFYQRHSGAVFNSAYRVMGNRSDAEDVMQTVFLNIYNRTPPLDLASTGSSYVRRAATNAAIDILRSRSSRPEASLEGRPDPKAHATNFLLKEALRRAMARLTPEESELFVLREIEGLSYDELAEQLELERGTVASRLHRIRQSLVKSLQR